MEQHRIAIEPRSGIWLLFYETLISARQGIYKQQLRRIFSCPESRKLAEAMAICEKVERKVTSDVIIRDDSEKNIMFRQA